MLYFFFKVKKVDIAMIKNLLEAYENIMTISTIDEARQKIQVTVAEDFASDAKEILDDMALRFQMESLPDEPTKSQGNY